MCPKVEIATRYTKAVTKMLLADKMLKPGVALLAGGPVDLAKKFEMARIAHESDTDLIHLTFDDTPTGYALVGLHICVPRDGVVHALSDCQLSLVGRRTVIMPIAACRGHFVLSPRELIHKPAKPDGWVEGLQHAQDRLRELVIRGVDTTGQIVINQIHTE